jgi:hypothetical protein
VTALFQCGNSPRASAKTPFRHDAGARGSTAGHTILNDAIPTPSPVANNKPGISLLLSGSMAFLASRTKLANTVQVSVGQLFNETWARYNTAHEDIRITKQRPEGGTNSRRCAGGAKPSGVQSVDGSVH